MLEVECNKYTNISFGWLGLYFVNSVFSLWNRSFLVYPLRNFRFGIRHCKKKNQEYPLGHLNVQNQWSGGGKPKFVQITKGVNQKNFKLQGGKLKFS